MLQYDSRKSLNVNFPTERNTPTPTKNKDLCEMQ